jgi:hypothetical protein
MCGNVGDTISTASLILALAKLINKHKQLYVKAVFSPRRICRHNKPDIQDESTPSLIVLSNKDPATGSLLAGPSAA